MAELHYAKTLLYLYPQTSGIVEAIETEVENKAVLSFRGGSTEQAIEGIVKEMALKVRLLEAKEYAGRALRLLSEKERALIGYKYFKEENCSPREEYSRRGYFRKQNEALLHFAKALKLLGYDEEKFFAAFSDYPFLMRGYEKIKRSNRGARSDLNSRQSSSEGGGAGRLRNIRNAKSTRSTHPTQMSAICNPVKAT